MHSYPIAKLIGVPDMELRVVGFLGKPVRIRRGPAAVIGQTWNQVRH